MSQSNLGCQMERLRFESNPISIVRRASSKSLSNSIARPISSNDSSCSSPAAGFLNRIYDDTAVLPPYGPGDEVGNYVLQREIGSAKTEPSSPATSPSVAIKVISKQSSQSPLFSPNSSQKSSFSYTQPSSLKSHSLENQSQMPHVSFGDRVDSIEQLSDILDHETNIWRQLDHPNIISLHQVVHADDAIFVISEIAKGGNLYSYLKERGSGIPEEEAARIFREILFAIKYMHDSNIVHRDIKCENILLVEKDQTPLLHKYSNNNMQIFDSPIQSPDDFLFSNNDSKYASHMSFMPMTKHTSSNKTITSSNIPTTKNTSSNIPIPNIKNNHENSSCNMNNNFQNSDFEKQQINYYTKKEPKTSSMWIINKDNPTPSPITDLFKESMSLSSSFNTSFGKQQKNQKNTHQNQPPSKFCNSKTSFSFGSGDDDDDDKEEDQLPPKPINLSNYTFKIADFGLSTTTNHPPSKSTPECCVGSLHYCSPEEIKQVSSANPSSDVWSLGCVLYALLTGALPFHDDYLPRLQMSIINGRFDRGKLDGVGKGARELVEGMLKVKVEERWGLDRVCMHPWVLNSGK